MDKPQDKMLELSKQEMHDWNLYLKIYETKSPKPVMPTFFNWQFGLSLVGAIGAVAFSAFRNSAAFYTIADRSGTPPWAVWGEAISGVAAVNILLVSLALLLSYKRRNVSDLSTYVGVGIVLLIGCLVGLSQSFQGLGISGWVEGINLCLAIMMGVGVTILEWLGGDMLGVSLVRFEEFQQTSKREHQTNLQTWEANARRGFGTWLANKENKLAKLQTNEPNTNAQSQVRQTQQTNTHQRTQTHRITNSEANIVSLLDTVLANEHRLLGVSELAGLLAQQTNIDPANIEQFVRQKKGYISQVRSRWMTEKGITQ